MSNPPIQENQPANREALAEILWIGESFPTEIASIQFCENKIPIRKLSWTGGFADLLQKPYSLVVGEISDRGQLEILENLRLPHPETWVGVCFTKEAPKDLVRRALNSGKMKFFVEGEKERIEQDLLRPLQQQNLSQRRTGLLREYYQRNKNLESLTSDLEKLVSERTVHLEQSNKDQTEKIQMERTLIRFVKEIAALSAVEDVLRFLRKELRKFHRLGEPVLIIQSGKNNEIYYFRNGIVQRSFLSKPFPYMDVKEMSSSTASKELANILARPFARAALFPLSLKLLTQFHEADSKAQLCFEHSLGADETKMIEEFLNERINPISLSLDRILLEQELDTFSYRWEKIFDGIRDPIAIIDVQYRVLRSNKQFVQGFKSHFCHKTFAQRDEICPGCPLILAAQEGRPQSGEVKVNDRIYQVWSYPIRLEHDEKATSFVNQYVDITEYRALYARMLQQEKMGAIGTLAGHIAHELNNPLTGIRSLAQVLLHEKLSTEVKQDLSEIEKAAVRCQKIIKNLLEFTQENETETEEVSLDEIVERTLPMLKTALRSHRLSLRLNSKDHRIRLLPQLMQQVVFNLVNNACQAMKTAGEIRISTQSTPEGGVELVISDTGPGIPADLQTRIFEPFFTTKDVGEGTGLGLSISKQIVERCGGKIHFTSEVGKGTDFHIHFPAQRNRDEVSGH